jgi:hypothetical protein
MLRRTSATSSASGSPPVALEFVGAAGGRPVRGSGEPIWPERTAAELVECERHESLLNLAFAGAPAWWLLSPYDTEALSAAIIDEARRSTFPAGTAVRLHMSRG